MHMYIYIHICMYVYTYIYIYIYIYTHKLMRSPARPWPTLIQFRFNHINVHTYIHTDIWIMVAHVEGRPSGHASRKGETTS